MPISLYDFPVTDRHSFVEFIALLREDLLTNRDSWENPNLDGFLEALGAYALDIQGYYDNTKQQKKADEPDWQTFANIFIGAKVYE